MPLLYDAICLFNKYKKYTCTFTIRKIYLYTYVCYSCGGVALIHVALWLSIIRGEILVMSKTTGQSGLNIHTGVEASHCL